MADVGCAHRDVLVVRCYGPAQPDPARLPVLDPSVLKWI